MAKQLQNMLRRSGAGGGGRGLPGGVSWGAGLLLGAGALGFGVQQSIYTGLYVCSRSTVCVCVCVEL